MKASLIEHKQIQTAFKQNKFWLRQDPRTLMNIGLFDVNQRTMYDVSIYKLSEEFDLEQLIEAKEIRYDGRHWNILSGTQRTFHDDGTIEIAAIQNQTMALEERPEDFQQMDLSEDAMKFSEIQRYVRRLEREGYPASRYAVELHRKLAAPFMSLVMAVLAVPVGLMGKQGTSTARGIGLSLLIGFSYWVLYSVCISLGRGGFLPPFLAGWLPHLSFLGIGTGWMISLRQ